MTTALPPAAARLAAFAGPDGPTDPLAATGAVEVLYDRHGVLVVRIGDTVVKSHQPGRVDLATLAARLTTAATLPDLLLPPLGPPRELDGLPVTVWPHGVPVDPDRPLPWAAAGSLLARLHRAPVPPDAPRQGPSRAPRVVAALGAGPEADTVRRAFATLPDHVREGAPPPGPPGGPPGGILVHGDWHLGQMVHHGGRWRLIDVEDLGVGDPAWDLARPAALYLAGALYAEDWTELLDAYRAADGPVGADGDLWRPLETPARTLVIQMAATCVQRAQEEDRGLRDEERTLVTACARIAEAATGPT